ncbi:hypothetical protein ACFLZ5_10695 [Thermodesulfobacteriota bacterium]
MKRNVLLNVLAIAIGVFISIFAIEIVLRLQNFLQLDGFHNESPWHQVFHHGDGSFKVRDYGADCNSEKIKLLLLGDSWMEDEFLSNTIGNEFADKSGKCVQTVNGANSSYSPTLYLLKGRQAFETYGQFDYIIVNIDETDIGDEWLRCRIPTVRDTSGKIVAVPYDNDLHARYLWNGKLWAESSRFYIIRLIKFAYFYKVLVPSIYKFTFSPEYSSWMQYVFVPDAASLFKKENEYFEERLLEMADEISGYGKGANSVFVTHHPHLRGLVDSIDKGKLYLPIVSDAIARLPEKTGVKVLDARDHVMQIHGDAFPDNTYIDGDPFSHLNGDGGSRYGKWIVEQINLK